MRGIRGFALPAFNLFGVPPLGGQGWSTGGYSNSDTLQPSEGFVRSPTFRWSVEINSTMREMRELAWPAEAFPAEAGTPSESDHFALGRCGFSVGSFGVVTFHRIDPERDFDAVFFSGDVEE